MELDDVDRAMLGELQADGRVSIPKLAEAVGLSRAAAYSRFDRLVDGGAITGFTVRVDHHAIGLDVAALVMISARQGSWEALRDRLTSIGAVEWIGLATGPFDFIVRVRCPDLHHLRDVVLGELQAMDDVRTTQTVMLLDEIPATLELAPE